MSSAEGVLGARCEARASFAIQGAYLCVYPARALGQKEGQPSVAGAAGVGRIWPRKVTMGGRIRLVSPRVHVRAGGSSEKGVLGARCTETRL